MKKLDPYFVTGFTEGEGSFYVGILPKNLDAVAWEVRPSFSLSQHKRNKSIVYRLKDYFGCGWIRPSKKDDTLKYEVRSLEDLTSKILPHFERYPLEGDKSRDFDNFRKVVRLMATARHLTNDGLIEIVNIVVHMTKNPKRLNSLNKIQALLKE